VIYNISASCEGSLLLSGYLVNPSEPNYDGWIGKLNANGTEQWMQTVEIAPSVNSYTCGILATSINDYVAVTQQNSDVRISRFSNVNGYTAGQIVTTPIPAQELCEGSEFVVAYTSTPTNSGNVFTCEMSNSSGDFSSPVVLGTIQSQNSGSIVCQIPESNSVSGFKIRVVASNPFMIGSAVGFEDCNSINISNAMVSHFVETMGTSGVITTIALHESANAFDMDKLYHEWICLGKCQWFF